MMNANTNTRGMNRPMSRLSVALLLALSLPLPALAADGPWGGGMMQRMHGSDPTEATDTATANDTATTAGPGMGMMRSNDDNGAPSTGMLADDGNTRSPMTMMERMRERVMGDNDEYPGCQRQRMIGNGFGSGTGMGPMGMMGGRRAAGMGPMGMGSMGMGSMGQGSMGMGRSGMLGANDDARLERIERRLAAMDALLREMAYGR